MKHLVKFTRHWKGCFKITISDAELRNIFHDEEALDKFIDEMIEKAYDKLFSHWLERQADLNFGSLVEQAINKQTEQRKEFPYPWWNDIPKGTRIYGYIKEDKPII